MLHFIFKDLVYLAQCCPHLNTMQSGKKMPQLNGLRREGSLKMEGCVSKIIVTPGILFSLCYYLSSRLDSKLLLLTSTSERQSSLHVCSLPHLTSVYTVELGSFTHVAEGLCTEVGGLAWTRAYDIMPRYNLYLI